MDPEFNLRARERARGIRWTQTAGAQASTVAAAAATSAKCHVNQRRQPPPAAGRRQPPPANCPCGIEQFSGTCDSLPINDIRTERQLFVVGNQLAQLIEPPPPARTLRQHTTSHRPKQPASQRPPSSCARIKSVLRIYLKLLNAGPLALHLPSSCPEVLNTRQQVLAYIESLPGYCDSINSLRLILKSPTMISTMRAYEEILGRLADHERGCNGSSSSSNETVSSRNQMESWEV